MTNEEKRALLRDLRRKLAEMNDIVWLSSDSACQNGCSGECPACRAELRYLETEINRRAAQGKAILLCRGNAEEDVPAPTVHTAEVVTPVRDTSGSLLDMPLDEVGLNLRTRVCLEGGEITTLRQLLTMSPSELKRIRNMTQEGLDEIEYQLGLLGLGLEKDL